MSPTELEPIVHLSEEKQIFIPGRWAIVLILLTTSGIFGAGGWATWMFQMLNGISNGMSDLQAEVRETRIHMEERVSNLENDSKQIKFCLRMMEGNPGRVECKLD